MNRQASLMHFFIVTSFVAITLPLLMLVSDSGQMQYLAYPSAFVAAVVAHLAVSSLRMRWFYRWVAVTVGPSLMVQGLLGVPGAWPGSRFIELVVLISIATTGMVLTSTTQRWAAPKPTPINNNLAMHSRNGG